ncbi:transglycosylase SLT domain protein [Erythrobacter sp. NAP1]|uniref:lytic transglycosylase domain-containing protein n=1 Tax=Erythrobacter sp. NAP1 TaxID=237727 RepID=UPI0000685215|nr:transglycosylase SLT domain protein [Erythrobacter sp. NAP1]
MILARASRSVSLGMTFPSALLALAFVASTAHADVMEVDADGARWVAGGQPVEAADSVLVGETDQGFLVKDGATELSAIYVPENIVGDTVRHASGIPPQYAAKIHELAERFDLSPALLEAVVWQESRWRPTAVSHAGARGLAQLMPGTARDLGVDPDDPMQNLEGGARYLREQLDRFEGDLEKALAAYNAGPGRVIRAGGIPNIRETRQYVAAIMGRLSNHSRPGVR